LAPNWGGIQNAYGSNMTTGQSFVHHFTFQLNNTWHSNKIEIVGLLVDPSGAIDNASTTSIEKAISNGYADFAGMNIPAVTPDRIQLYPNPAGDVTNVLLNLNNTSLVQFEIYQINGVLLSTKSYSLQSGMQQVPIQLTNLSSGVYLLKVIENGQVTTLKINRQ
jgi:hypothetical protein